MTDESELIAAVTKTATVIDDRKILPCAAALDLAKKLDVTPAQVGKICNDNNIKITNCQLGCFK